MKIFVSLLVLTLSPYSLAYDEEVWSADEAVQFSNDEPAPIIVRVTCAGPRFEIKTYDQNGTERDRWTDPKVSEAACRRHLSYYRRTFEVRQLVTMPVCKIAELIQLGFRTNGRIIQLESRQTISETRCLSEMGNS